MKLNLVGYQSVAWLKIAGYSPRIIVLIFFFRKKKTKFYLIQLKLFVLFILEIKMHRFIYTILSATRTIKPTGASSFLTLAY